MSKKSIYYDNINGLLKADVDYEYEDWQVKEIIKCKNNIEYFLETYVKINHQEKGWVPFKLYDFQKKFIKCIQENKYVAGLISRQAGKTASMVGYVLHYMIFAPPGKNIGILGNNATTAKRNLKRIKDMYKSIPEWLQVGVISWNTMEIELGNNNRVIASATHEDALSGESLSLCLVDEVAKIKQNLFDDFIRSIGPTLSTSKDSKLILFSTPKGLNHWFRIVHEARNGRGYTLFSTEWNEIPGRDEKFKQEILAKHDYSYWAQEYLCEFLGSSNSLISMQKLKSIPIIDPIETKYDNNFKIYEYPKEDYIYFNISDYGEGLEKDYSTIQVIKYEPETSTFEQVAVYKDNTSNQREFALIKKMIGDFYNEALIIGENNIGQESLNELFEELEYGEVYFDPQGKGKIGVRTTRNKSRWCGNLKSVIENDKLRIVDFETVQDLSTFVKKGNSYAADEESHFDDLVIPLVIFAKLINDEDFVSEYIENYELRKNDKKIEEEDILPSYFVDECSDDDFDYLGID